MRIRVKTDNNIWIFFFFSKLGIFYPPGRARFFLGTEGLVVVQTVCHYMPSHNDSVFPTQIPRVLSGRANASQSRVVSDELWTVSRCGTGLGAMKNLFATILFYCPLWKV